MHYLEKQEKFQVWWQSRSGTKKLMIVTYDSYIRKNKTYSSLSV